MKVIRGRAGLFRLRLANLTRLDEEAGSGESLELLERAAADEDFGGWACSEAAAEPLLDPVRDDPRFPG